MIITKRIYLATVAALFLYTAAPALSQVPFSYKVIEPQQVPNGHKPKVIGDFANNGSSSVGAYTAGEGFKLYKYPGYTPFLITTYQDGSGSEDAQVADVNGDGALDIIVGGYYGSYWLENPLKQGVDPYSSAWKVHFIDGTLPSHDVVAGDINHDGKIDLATESGVYLQGSTPDTWIHVGLSKIARSVQGTWLGDMTGDGFLDVIAPNATGTRLSWFENPLHKGGNPVSDTWTEHVIDSAPGFTGNMTSATVDLNDDGRVDVVMSPMYTDGNLAWYEAPSDPRTGAWIKHIIGTTHYVHQGSLQIADFNGDGVQDIAFAEQEQSVEKRIGIFLNQGGGASWKLQVLATTGGHNLKAGLIGGDRYPSLLCANHAFFGAPNPVELWRNVSGGNPTSPAPAGGPVSDEFNSSALNTSLWTFEDPVGDGTVGLTGSAAVISAPAKVAHDPWSSNLAAILTQTVANVDFGVEVKFDSHLTSAYQMQGIIVESDKSNYLRFETYFDGTNLHLFAASIVADRPMVQLDTDLAPVSGSFWIRVRRNGDAWTQTWSTDGVNFKPGVVFNSSMKVTRLGPYAGNDVGPNGVPAITAKVDYFRSQ